MQLGGYCWTILMSWYTCFILKHANFMT
ncbi:UNVERIFIED_CONTAM: hypothetical protein GTU68_057863 [Idotea baltica]|nr:hypothetical protein [Idotea baltica]